jgi:hypothetical protein
VVINISEEHMAFISHSENGGKMTQCNILERHEQHIPYHQNHKYQVEATSLLVYTCETESAFVISLSGKH